MQTPCIWATPLRACSKRVRSWAASVSFAVPCGGSAAPAAAPPAMPDDLCDPLLSLCSDVQLLAVDLRQRDRLDAAVARARAMPSVQARALSLAQRLDLL